MMQEKKGMMKVGTGCWFLHLLPVDLRTFLTETEERVKAGKNTK